MRTKRAICIDNSPHIRMKLRICRDSLRYYRTHCSCGLTLGELRLTWTRGTPEIDLPRPVLRASHQGGLHLPGMRRCARTLYRVARYLTDGWQVRSSLGDMLRSKNRNTRKKIRVVLRLVSMAVRTAVLTWAERTPRAAGTDGMTKVLQPACHWLHHTLLAPLLFSSSCAATFDSYKTTCLSSTAFTRAASSLAACSAAAVWIVSRVVAGGARHGADHHRAQNEARGKCR